MCALACVHRHVLRLMSPFSTCSRTLVFITACIQAPLTEARSKGYIHAQPNYLDFDHQPVTGMSEVRTRLCARRRVCLVVMMLRLARKHIRIIVAYICI